MRKELTQRLGVRWQPVRNGMADIEGFTALSKEIGAESAYLVGDFNNWNEAWVRHVKTTEGIEELTDEHWKVINVLQDYYKKNGIAPMVRILSKVTGFKLKYIYELFPSGPGKGACKMAGLPKPTGCV